MNSRVLRAALWIFTCTVFILTSVRADDDAQAREALWLADHAKLKHKVDTLVIGDVNLKDATIDQVLDFLRRQSKLADSDHQGVNFVNGIQRELRFKKISIKLKDATIPEVLQQFPFTAYSVGDFVVSLRTENETGLSYRTFTVPDNRLAINDSMIIDKDKQTYDVRVLFEAKGIHFQPGTSAIYTLPAKSLTVVQVDPEDIIRIDELLVFGFKSLK